MSNVIVLLVDSLSYEENMLDDMPRLKSREENIISFTNYFAQAPYTEAATIPIYTASNVTDYQGHMNNLKDRPLNINEIFQNLGYKTYNTLWFYPNTLSFLRGVDEYDYMTSEALHDIIRYRIDYFKDLYFKNEFTKDDMNIMKILLDDFFEMTQIYVEDYYTQHHKFDLLIKYTEFDKKKFQEFVIKEKENREKYFRDKETFIFELLNNENDFFNDNGFKIKRSNYFNEKKMRLNISMFLILIKQIYHSIKKRSKNRSLKVLKHRLVNRDNQSIYRVFRGWIAHIGGHTATYIHNSLSGKVILDRTYEYLKSNQNKNNFVLTHLMDTHYPFNFISSEEEEIEFEFKKLNRYQNNFKTAENNFYRFSKLYIDEKIDDFINKIETNDQVQDTTIIITSDHGSSHLGKIFRNDVTSTFYDENYQIPFLIYNKNIKSAKIDKLSISKQFIPTILDFLKVEGYDEIIEENSIFQKNQDSIIFEYFGSGCPDYTRKSKLFCIRNEHYKIQYEHFPGKNNELDQIIAIYDIRNDPRELINLKDSISNDTEILNLVSLLKSRIDNII